MTVLYCLFCLTAQLTDRIIRWLEPQALTMASPPRSRLAL